VRRALGLLLALAAGPVAAEDYVLPTLFDVVEVASDHALVVRAAPDPAARVVGTLAANARRVEVVALDASGRWGQVNLGEASGWVVMRYLAFRSEVWVPGSLPPSLACHGTEPFWSLRAAEDTLTFATPDTPELTLGLETVLDRGILRDPFRAVIARSRERRLTATIAPGLCSDGMSNRVLGLSATAILEGRGEPYMLTGCCSVAPTP